MSKKNIILNIDLGFHGVKVRTTVKESAIVDYFNMPAEVAICPENSFSSLSRLKEAKGSVIKFDGKTYAIGMAAIDYLSDYSFRNNYYDNLSKSDKAFYDLDPRRFTSSLCDMCVLGAITMAFKRLIEVKAINDYKDASISALCFVLPHNIVVDKNSIATEHIWDFVSEKHEISISFDSGKSFCDLSIGSKDSTIIINEDNLFVHGQAGAVLYDTILNEDLSVKEFIDDEGNKHDILSDPHYFNPLLILDIGKRTCKPLIMRNLGSVEEIPGFSDMKYAMYNVDERVAQTINEFFEIEEGSSGYIYADDIDRLLNAGQTTYNPFHSGDDKGANLLSIRKRVAKELCKEMVEEIISLTKEGKRFFDFMSLVCIAGGSAKLFYPVLKELIMDARYNPREESIILCEEKYSDTEYNTVYSVVGGSYRKLIFENPELLEKDKVAKGA